jgi:hypothetical protein
MGSGCRPVSGQDRIDPHHRRSLSQGDRDSSQGTGGNRPPGHGGADRRSAYVGSTGEVSVSPAPAQDLDPKSI